MNYVVKVYLFLQPYKRGSDIRGPLDDLVLTLSSYLQSGSMIDSRIFSFQLCSPSVTHREQQEVPKSPISSNSDPDGEPVDQTLYRSMIGSLMYLTASRPDVLFAVYSNYGGCEFDRKSTSAGCQFLGDRLISWQCKKQQTVSTSTAEAEYVAASACCSQVIWMQHQLLDYGLDYLNTTIFCDNDAAIQITKNPVQHSKTKHIDIKVHFIRDCYERGLIHLAQVHTDNNVADLFTKPFARARFDVLVGFLKMLRFED
ncbi:hypothetical protein LXL04_008151 [Taraxacum kok-saghyz]